MSSMRRNDTPYTHILEPCHSMPLGRSKRSWTAAGSAFRGCRRDHGVSEPWRGWKASTFHDDVMAATNKKVAPTAHSGQTVRVHLSVAQGAQPLERPPLLQLMLQRRLDVVQCPIYELASTLHQPEVHLRPLLLSVKQPPVGLWVVQAV